MLKCYHCGKPIDWHNGEVHHTVLIEDNEQNILGTLCHTCFMLHFDYESNNIVENSGLGKSVTKEGLKKLIINYIGDKNYKRLKINKPIDKNFEELSYYDD
jgi:hypothetical protein